MKIRIIGGPGGVSHGSAALKKSHKQKKFSKQR